ncbi:MAG: hypothetical protein KDD66_04730 [Bdellovibrionales bacterium]|nr:hypothetical protein [Bdellovibrionales bacterium]
MFQKGKLAPKLFMSMLLVGLTSCSSAVFDNLNPYAEEGVPMGERNSNALRDEVGDGSGNGSDNARHALEVMGSYRRAQAPQPTYPVVQPAEVRLMWVPDHLNRTGDLVPAHYYYLKVLNDRWAVQDAFDLEKQLNDGSSTNSSATPWVEPGSTGPQ